MGSMIMPFDLGVVWMLTLHLHGTGIPEIGEVAAEVIRANSITSHVVEKIWGCLERSCE